MILKLHKVLRLYTNLNKKIFNYLRISKSKYVTTNEINDTHVINILVYYVLFGLLEYLINNGERWLTGTYSIIFSFIINNI